MKIKFLFASLFAAILFASCSHSSDDSGSSSTDNIPLTYTALKTNNYWNYNVSSTYNGTTTPSKDSLHIGNDTLISAITYKIMKSTGINPAGNQSGFYSSILHNNGLRIDGSRLKLSGTVNLPTLVSNPITLNLSDFIIFKENATSGTELSSVSGSFTQTVQTYPLNFNYTFKSISDESLSTFVSNGHTYTDIKKTKLILNLTVTYPTTISGIATTLTVLPAQDVITSIQYYSKNIGVVYNNTNIQYALNPSVVTALNLPPTIPTSGNLTQEEFLAEYHLN